MVARDDHAYIGDPIGFSALAEDYAFAAYHQARGSFLSKAKATHAAIESHVHPCSPHPSGAVFGVDTAWYGPRDAKTILVMISGTHGLELFSGSAMQRLWMDQHKSSAPQDLGVLLIHAINPYGSAHASRTTENNVDLNRNFTDFSKRPDRSPITSKVQDTLSLSSRRGPRLSAVLARLFWLSVRYGKTRILNEVTAGQYQCPDGIGYGGDAPEWSNTLLKDILSRFLGLAKRVAVLDWHTGIGAYGKPFFLCFDAPGTAEFDRAVAWWGDSVSQSAKGFGGKAKPEYQGLLLKAVQDILHTSGAETTAAVIEFGTYPNQKMLQALLRDRWLRSEVAKDATAQERSAHLEAIKTAFCPDDPAWRESVIRHGQTILTQTMTGLAQWQSEHE